MSKICIFEDSNYTKLLPLVYTRAVYELRCGINTLLEKIVRQYPTANFVLYCRDYLAPVLKEKYKYPINESFNEDCLFINGRILMRKQIPIDGNEEVGIKNNTVIYIRLKKPKVTKITPEKILDPKFLETLKSELPVVSYDVNYITYSWDLVNYNSQEIKNDFLESRKSGIIEGKVYEGTYILNKSQVYIGKGTEIKPGVVIDAETGPVYIGENVSIEPNAVIQGPTYIGDKSIIRLNAKIREGTSIGEVSRIGGEIEESIIHSYSNKQHDGFLGHAYIGSWCNLGAGTNNSDLKNNYGTVKVYVEGKLIDSGSMFVGLTMADHSKSGIGTNFNTGTVVGVSANIFGGGMPPKYIPSFSWGGEEGLTEYRLEEAIETAKIVMSRRKINMSLADENLLRKIFELTKSERGKPIL